ncbi:MAG: ComF family protein [Candidatus Caldatribacteriota bacterium]|nr:ComF family protein [Candidatus Caldatribacteriota bacterium]
MIEYIKEGLLNFVFPLDCKICKKPIRESRGYSICEDCFNTIEFIKHPYCMKCGKPLIHSEFFLKNKNILCVNCREKKYSFEFARSVGTYNKVLRKCIHLFKYYREKKLAKPLGKLMIDYLLESKEFEKKIDLIIPVPLHEKGLKKRGFNQTILLSREIGNYFSIPVKEEILVKKKITSFQVNLSKKEREKNINKAFLVKEPEEFKGKNILIIDDVFTTGSTVDECAKEIKRAQAKNIYVFTLARSISEPGTVFP